MGILSITFRGKVRERFEESVDDDEVQKILERYDRTLVFDSTDECWRMRGAIYEHLNSLSKEELRSESLKAYLRVLHEIDEFLS